MCLGIPGQIVELRPSNAPLARIDVAGVRRDIHVGLLGDDLRVGDWVLVHVGFALSRIDEADAARALEAFGSIGQNDDDAAPSVAESTIT